MNKLKVIDEVLKNSNFNVKAEKKPWDMSLEELDAISKKLDEDLKSNRWQNIGIGFYDKQDEYPAIWVDVNGTGVGTIYNNKKEAPVETFEEYFHSYDELIEKLNSEKYKIFLKKVKNRKDITSLGEWKPEKQKYEEWEGIFQNDKYHNILVKMDYSTGNFNIFKSDATGDIYGPQNKKNKLDTAKNIEELNRKIKQLYSK